MLDGDNVEADQILISLDPVLGPALGQAFHVHVARWSGYEEGRASTLPLVLGSCSASSWVVVAGVTGRGIDLGEGIAAPRTRR